MQAPMQLLSATLWFIRRVPMPSMHKLTGRWEASGQLQANGKASATEGGSKTRHKGQRHRLWTCASASISLLLQQCTCAADVCDL